MNRNIHRPRYFFIFFIIAGIFFYKNTYAQESKQAHVIYLRNESVVPPANAAAYISNLSSQKLVSQPIQVLLHFTTLPTPAQRAQLQQAGVTLIDYLPDNTFSALLQAPLNKEQILSQQLYSVIEIKPEWKAGEYIWNEVATKKGSVEVLVSFCPGIDIGTIRQYISGLGGKINPGKMEKHGAYNVVIAAASLSALAQWYGVRAISPVTEMVPLDLESRPSVKGNIAVSSPIYGGYGLLGDSVTVGVGDDASGIYHADIKDRIINFNPAVHSNHGEHVNGIVGGAGNVDPFGVGMAPHVALLDYLYDFILPDIGPMYYEHNMTITNNSYEVMASNCSYAGTYDIYSQFLDSQSIKFPWVANVFASGNDGLLNCPPYLQGFATVGGGYQPAKNNIVVGSMTDFYQQANDESRGPVKDGRLKPEIIAIGLVAYSTVGVDQYEWAAGTSMAAPQVAGGMAVLEQRYKQLNSSTEPQSDLLKAILLNGTMDLGNPGPDYTFGFGAMDIYRSLQMIDNGNYTTNNISNGDSQTITISVPPNTGQLKVMLCWNDMPASTFSSKQLVNDLDLVVYDPSSTKHLPLVLDPTPANVNNNATEQEDHLNNVEQVTVNNPASGTYTVKIKGHSIPYGPQQYVIAYDIIPKGLHLTYPIGGEQLANGSTPFDSVRVFWDAVTDGNPFTVQLSQDNGGSWITLSNNIPPDARHFSFLPFGMSTGKVLIRLSRNNTSEVATSQRFSINTPPVVALDSVQCPGYINIHWTPVLNARGYYLLRKVGNYMQVVDSVTEPFYSFKGMPLNATSYVAVQPIIDGRPGCRSIALSTTANTGSCTSPISYGDLLIEKIVSPNAGRLYTSTDPVGGYALKVRLRTLYDSSCSYYTLSYKVDSGAWHTSVNPGTIPSNGTTDISVATLSLPIGTYNISVAVHNVGVTDPLPANDTLTFTYRSLPNDTINLATPFSDNFETMGEFTVGNDSIGVSPNAHWDYFNNNDGLGRMRSFVKADITIAGFRSVSLDQNQNLLPGSKNSFTGTFNLINYDTATAEVRMDFDYILHGTPKSAVGNVVSVRANDTTAWNQFFAYDIIAYPGNVTHVRSLSLTDALRLSHKNFSSAFQVSFGQSDTSLIAAVNYGNGLTLDNFRLYTVANDASLVSVVSPTPSSCGLPAAQPLIVQVHNGVNHTLYNVHMFYTLDGGPVVTGTIDSIKAKRSVNYTFSQPLNTSPGSTHSLNIWLSEAGDTYNTNDTILNYHYRNSPIISTFPYLENFEQGDGGYYSDGFKNSWQYGTPASPNINKAASGTKAWKTNLTGNYNNLELSYLYSPCFDISSLTSPMLSFSTAMDLENCGRTLCDAAYIECSFDGELWTKLGSVGQGTNWYDSTFDVWNTKGFTRWHVASIPLPQPGGGAVLHLRFVLAADPGVTYEGVAVDDIHIFDRAFGIHPANGAASASHDLGGDQWTDFTLANQLLASVEPRNQSIPNTMVTLYAHDTLNNPGATQYTFPRSYTVKTQSAADSVGVRLFLTDSEVVMVTKDTTCTSCHPVTDAYSLGVTQYTNKNNPAAENGTLGDDTGGVVVYHPHSAVKWVPYDNGYYAELNAKPSSELWFNDGGPAGNFPASADYISFLAYRNGQYVTAAWYSQIDTLVSVYTPQWSVDSIHFADVVDTPARHIPVAAYSVNDYVNFAKYSVFYYRLKWTMTSDNKVYYSPVRRIGLADSSNTLITFDAQMVDHQNVQLRWTSYLDGIVNNYKLERAVGSGSYATVSNTPSRHTYGQQYTYFDQPGSIPGGRIIHYRLTAVLQDGTNVVLPERTVEWIDRNAIVNVYPNPTYDGSLTIEWHADAGTLMHINISDAVGQTVYETNVLSTQWTNTTTIQTTQHPHGVFFMRIEIDGKKYVRKIVYL